MQLESKDIDFGEGNIRLYRAGEAGPPVVLLHGGGLDAALISWRHTIPALVKDYSVFAFDWPKQGHSHGWTRVMDTKALVDILGNVLDHLGLKRVTLIGLSMGSAAAIGYTLERPERVESLVLTSAGGLQKKVPYHFLAWLMLKFPGARKAGMGGTKEKLRRRLEKGLFKSEVSDIEQVTEDVWQEMQRRDSAFSDFQIAELGLASVKVNFMPRLHEITQPTLIIHGKEDSVVPIQIAQEAASRLPNAEICEMENTGHWPNRETPEMFNSKLLSFLGHNRKANV
ncbi:MAG: alpha/beta hydrolase [Pseudomonadota bacterium]